ncbi:MAG: hypothetical protein HYZ94_01355 [Candidatus Omnitrophica bacterium]|nr:hypothetical protein [Candidatus Omnitrophota bacterium]
MTSKTRLDDFAGRGIAALSLAVLVSGSAWAADLQGSVVLEGPPPPPKRVTLQAKSKQHSIEGCGAIDKISPTLVVDADGGIRNAVVWIEAAAAERGPEDAPLLMDQNQCVFEPHVVAIPAGRAVAIRNSDSVIHNVRIFREGKPEMLMRQWQKADAADIVWKFEEPGRYLVRCGVHPWMYGWVFVAPGREASVTDGQGRFTLAGVPPGRHTLKVWHETLGSREISIEVGPDGKRIEPIRFPAPERSEQEAGGT